MPRDSATARAGTSRTRDERSSASNAEVTERRTSAELQAAILEAAQTCFARWGVQRTKMGDIAKELGIARPNLYRFYPSKQALVLEVMLISHRDVNEERRRTVKLRGPVSEVIIESVLVGWRRMVKDEEIRYLNDPDNFALSAMLRTSDEMVEVRRDYWFPVFDYGRGRGEIREDLDNDDLMFWLTVVQAIFLEDTTTFPDEDSVRSAVEQFVLPALLKDQGGRRARARRP
jgi:AcrR family transcriptional regulator